MTYIILTIVYMAAAITIGVVGLISRSKAIK